MNSKNIFNKLFNIFYYNTYTHPSNEKRREIFRDLFTEYNIDLALLPTEEMLNGDGNIDVCIFEDMNLVYISGDNVFGSSEYNTLIYKKDNFLFLEEEIGKYNNITSRITTFKNKNIIDLLLFINLKYI